MSLTVPVVFFNHAEIHRVGTEQVFYCELIINDRVIEKVGMFFSKSAMQIMKNYLDKQLELEKNRGEVRDVKPINNTTTYNKQPQTFYKE